MATVGMSVIGLANAWLNTLRGGGNGVSFSAPATLTLKLHTGIPGASGTNNYSVGDASTKTVTFAAAVNGSMASNNTPAWTNGGVDETITHLSLWNSGTFLTSGTLVPSRAWSATDILTLNTLTATLGPLAS